MEINLKTAPSTSAAERSERNFLLFMGGSILVIALIYFGFMLASKFFENKTEQVNASVKTEKAQLLGQKGIAVADFQKRIETSQNLVALQDTANESLMKTEALIVQGAYLDSFSFDGKKGTVAIECVADSFNTVAKQILNFRNSDYFAGFVSGVESLIDKDGKIRAKMELKIK